MGILARGCLHALGPSVKQLTRTILATRGLMDRTLRRIRPPLPDEPSYILHYHMYKNAGSSIDRLLAESFGDTWAAFDPAGLPPRIDDLRAFRAGNRQLRAISSHSTCLAWPGLPDTAACPVVMLRHPVDRVRSLHSFARRDPAQPDHTLAQGSLGDYVAFRLAHPGNRSGIANYQVAHLSEASIRCPAPWFAEPDASDLRHAQALLAGWPAHGLVARFAQSMLAFRAAYAGRVAGLNLYDVQENASQAAPAGDAEAIGKAREAMGEDVFARFLDANQLDLELYGFAEELFDRRIAAAGSAA